MYKKPNSSNSKNFKKKSNFKSNSKPQGSKNFTNKINFDSNREKSFSQTKVKNFYIKEKYDRLFGSGYIEKLVDLQRELSKNQFIRVNLSKRKPQEINDFLIKNRVKFDKTFLSTCFKINKSFFNLSSSVESLGGDIYIQDLASQVPVNTIDFSYLKKLNKKIRVLDIAASPGSKTTQLCDLLNFNKIEYEMVALEPQEVRITRLINNLQKQGCSNVEIFCEYGEKFKSKELFDLILVDAPCSGNVIGDNNWLSKRDEKGILFNSALQKKILENAFNLLSKEGLLVYSTCSLEVEEDEENVDFCVKKLNAKVQDINLKIPFSTKPLILSKFDKSISKSLRFNPLLSKTEGFFVALMRKS